VILPVVVFLYEWYFFQDLSWQWIRKKIPWLLGASVIVLFWFFVYLGKNPLANILHSCDNREFSTGERLLTELRVVVHYISLMLYPNPNRLTFDYDFPISTSLIHPLSTLGSFLILTVLFAAALYTSRKERFLSFCILWFFVNLIIESTVICVEIIYEHRTYLPSAFLVSGITALLYRVIRNSKNATIFCVTVTILFSYWTIVRNATWRDQIVFWEDNVSKSPARYAP